jgi:hypothetical protein
MGDIVVFLYAVEQLIHLISLMYVRCLFAAKTFMQECYPFYQHFCKCKEKLIAFSVKKYLHKKADHFVFKILQNSFYRISVFVKCIKVVYVITNTLSVCCIHFQFAAKTGAKSNISPLERVFFP